MSAARTLSIRCAGDADRQDIWTVHVRAIREVCSRSYSAEQIAAWAGLLSPDNYATAVQERVFLVAEDRGVVVGFGQLNPDNGEVESTPSCSTSELATCNAALPPTACRPAWSCRACG